MKKLLLVVAFLGLGEAAALAQASPAPASASGLPNCSASDAQIIKQGGEPKTPCHTNLATGPETESTNSPPVKSPQYGNNKPAN